MSEQVPQEGEEQQITLQQFQQLMNMQLAQFDQMTQQIGSMLDQFDSKLNELQSRVGVLQQRAQEKKE